MLDKDTSSLMGWSRVVLASSVCALALAILLIWPTGETPAEPQMRRDDRVIAKVVSQLISQHHLLKQPLDDEIAKRALDMYLKMLDPLKLYLLQGDVDEFGKQAHLIDDFVKNGDLTFAYQVFERYLQRTDSRVEDIIRLVDSEFDFTKDETMKTDPDDIAYAANEAELSDRWRRRLKYELMVRKADDEELDKAKDAIRRRYRSFSRRRHQTDGNELLEMYLTAVTSSLDPHTSYMSPDSLENFHINMKLNLEGIGAALQVEDGYTVVTKIIPGGAADKHGMLKPEDRIVSVGQGSDGEGDMEDVVDMKLSDVVKKIRGKAGTVVRLGVKPAGTTETKTYNITRARIELRDAEARGEIIEERLGGDDGPIYKIGVIDLPSFYMDMTAKRRVAEYKSTTRDVIEILDGFKEQGVSAVLLDLRRNGGGSLTEAISLTGLFIDQGVVVQVKDANGRVQYHSDDKPGMAWDGPLVVLASKFSASASEILAGAIQDYERGLVIGDESTHGKGTVQSLMNLGAQLFRGSTPPNWGALKITMQQFYRPNGDSTQKRGVLADVALPSLTNQMDVGEADLDYPVEFDRISAAPFRKLGMVTVNMLNELRARSNSRRRESEDFRKLMKNIRRYREQKERMSITLNEEEFLMERKEWDSDKEEQKLFGDQMEEDRPVFRRDFYTNEVIAVTLDYLQLLKQDALAATDTRPKVSGVVE